MAEIKYVDWDGLVYYDSKSKQYIDDKFEGCLKMGGIIPFSNLPSPSFQNLNYVYKITEEFTSNEFFEKQGYTYKAGTWVQVIDIDNVYLYTIFNEEDVTPILPGGELDLSNYYTISQTDDAISSAVASIEMELTDYATQQWVEDKGYLTDIPDEYTTVDFVVDAIDKAKPDLTPYATTTYVDDTIRSEIDAIPEPDLSDYAKLTDIPDVSKFITEIPDSYATKSYVDDAITDNLDGYAKSSEIPTVEDFIDAIPTKYVTDTELSAMNYATNSVVNEKADKNHKHSYNDLADLPTIPSIEGLATESFVEESVESAIESTVSNYYTKAEVDTAIDESISSIEIPEVDTDSFATKTELSAKSDAVLFTTDLFVNDPVGSFKIGDSVKGLTIKQILTKILALSPTVNPDTPDVPTTGGLVETIMADEISMYQLGVDGNVLEGSDYTYKEMTPEQASLAPTDECFYQIKDSSGEVIESGYQHLSIPTDDMFYLVLLPVGVTFGDGGNTTHQVWDEGQQIWTTSNLELTSDIDAIKAVLDENDLPFPVYNESDYTLWADSTFESWAGADYRFIINEDK